MDIAESPFDLLTTRRFELGYSEVKNKLNQFRTDGLIDKVQFEKIQNEDILLKVKYKT